MNDREEWRERHDMMMMRICPCESCIQCVCRVENSECCLHLFQRNKKEFLRIYGVKLVIVFCDAQGIVFIDYLEK